MKLKNNMSWNENEIPLKETLIKEMAWLPMEKS